MTRTRRIRSACVMDGALSLSIEMPGKIVCVGLNYRDEAEEQGTDQPTASPGLAR